ncbi:MAG: hypothetical protein AAF226_16555, partial [Verrucomicrobiota bacterium]
MIMLNLVIGVIINGMDDAKVEAEIERLRAAENELGAKNEFRLENQVKLLSAQVKDIGDAVERIGKVIEKNG